MTRERIQKVLARAGVASRRKVEEMIREGRITVDGQRAELGQKVDLERDAVKVDGSIVSPVRRPHTYLLVNKPPGVVSTASDPEGRPIVLDLVPLGMRRGLVPVGRLDFDSEGLLILTDDGDFAHRVAHPSHGCHKHYEVKVRGIPEESALDRLRAGIRLEGQATAPVGIHALPGRRGRRRAEANSWWAVELQEGRTRQIREIFQRIGHPVMRLRRVGIGGLREPRLTPGSWRHLEEHEIERLRGEGRR